MTHPADRVYRFLTLEHWGQGLAEGFLFGEGPDGALVTPEALAARALATVPDGETIEALAADPCGRLLWLLSDGTVMADRDVGAVQMAVLPRSVSHGARRLIWGQRTAWVVNGGSIVRLDALSGNRTGAFDAPGWRVKDAVADRCDGVIVVEYAASGRVRLRQIRPEGRARVLSPYDGFTHYDDFTQVIAAVRWEGDGPIYLVDLVDGGFRVVTLAPDGRREVSHNYAGRVPLGPITMDGPGRLVVAAKEYDLRLMSVKTTDDLKGEVRSLVIVALVGDSGDKDLHIRIFDTSGEKVVDKAEEELESGETLKSLKQQLTDLPSQEDEPEIIDVCSLSPEDKQEVIRKATSIVGDTQAKGGGIFTVAFGLMESLREIAAEGRFGEIRDLLWTDRGLYAATARRLYALEEVTGTAPAQTARYFGPPLRSPLGDRSGWLRADLTAELPHGAQLTITSRAFDSGLAASAYRAALRNEPNDPAVREGWNVANASVHFDDGSAGPLRHYLGHETAGYLALRLEVSVPASAGTARFKRLDVLYPNRSLIEALPAIYRTGTHSERQVRRMLAPFQALADEIDDLIGESIRRVDPLETDDLWTGFLLSWLGHSEFTGLPADQRRALLAALPEIVRLRGTLAGLARVMEILAPEGFSIEDGAAEPDFWVLPKPMDPAGARLGRETLAARHQPDALVLGECTPLGAAVLRHGCLDLGRLARCSGNVTVRVFGGDDVRARLEPFKGAIERSFAPANTRMDFIFGDHRPPERLVRGLSTGPDGEARALITLDDEKSRALGAWRLPRVGPSAPEHPPVLNSAVLDGNLTLE